MDFKIDTCRNRDEFMVILERYVEYYNKLYTKFAVIKQYNKLLEKCNQKKNLITKDNDNNLEKITNYQKEIENIKSTRSSIKKLTKRRD